MVIMKIKRVVSILLVCALLSATMSMYVFAGSGSFSLTPISSYSTKSIVSFYLNYSGCCGGSVTENPYSRSIKFVLLRSGSSYKAMPYWASYPTWQFEDLPSGYTYTLGLYAEALDVPGVKGTYYYY